MAPSCFGRALLLSAISFLLLFSTGFGRKMVDSSGFEKQAVGVHGQGKSREMIELDYVDAGPNVNANSGFPFSSPPPPPGPGLGY